MKRIILSIVVLALSLFYISFLPSPNAVIAEYDPNYPDLQIWNPFANYADNFFEGWDVYHYEVDMLPGITKEYPIRLTNRSYGGTLPLTLSFNLSSPQLTAIGPDATFFKVRFTDLANSQATPWYTLYQLLNNSTNTEFGFLPINQGEIKDYKIEFTMDQYSPGSLQNISIDDMQVRLIATSGAYQDIITISYFGFQTGSFTPVTPPTPTSTPSLSVKDRILLIPLCSPKINQFRVWSATNLSTQPITLNWSIAKISQSGSLTLAPRDTTYFKVDAYKGINATKFSWNDHKVTLYSLPLFCSRDLTIR